VERAVVRLLDLEARALEHRLEQPAERAVLISQVRLELVPRPAELRPRGRGLEPGGDARLGLARVEREDDVAPPEDAARPEERRDAFECDRLPEVGQVMEGPWSTSVLLAPRPCSLRRARSGSGSKPAFRSYAST
jgi:hypothetical protein